jgi:porin-like protein
MRRNRSHSPKWAVTAVLFACATAPRIARADIVFYDAEGWRVFTAGRVEGHYQLIHGDGDPISSNRLVGGQIQNTASQDENNRLLDSRIRSGFVGSQIGFGLNNKLSETSEAKAFVGIWLMGIDSNKGTPPQNKAVDVREAWGSIGGSFGTFIFGRAFSIFGSASGEVNAYAYEFAVGHPCLADVSTIACGSVGAGPLYAGYNAQLRYVTPRFAGFELQASIEDPTSLTDYHITRFPRFEGELNYLAAWSGDGKFVVKGQGLTQELGKLNDSRNGTVSTTAWGAMGVARLEVAGFRVGGGAWLGKGMGTHNALQQDDAARPLAQDLPGGQYPGDELRKFRGAFGNVSFGYHGTALAVGAGGAFVQETLSDASTVSTSLLKQNLEYHAVFTQRIHSIVLSAEFMHWRSEWYRGETQSLNFIGAGATFVW